MTGVDKPSGRIEVRLADRPGELARLTTFFGERDLNVHSILTHPEGASSRPRGAAGRLDRDPPARGGAASRRGSTSSGRPRSHGLGDLPPGLPELQLRRPSPLQPPARGHDARPPARARPRSAPERARARDARGDPRGARGLLRAPGGGALGGRGRAGLPGVRARHARHPRLSAAWTRRRAGTSAGRSRPRGASARTGRSASSSSAEASTTRGATSRPASASTTTSRSAIEALLRHGLWVAYLDIDVHHGDGVQQILYDDGRALTIQPPRVGHSSSSPAAARCTSSARAWDGA